MMRHHPIKCGCRKISSSVYVVETLMLDYMSPHYDPKLADSKQIFLHGTLAHDDKSPYQVRLQKVDGILSRYTFTGIFNLFYDLDLDYNRAVQFFLQDIPAYDDVQSNKV